MLSQRLPGLSALVVGATLLFVAGCSQESPTGAPTPQSEGFQEVTLEVAGMSCEVGCAARAKTALASLPWVKNVKVDFENKQATLSAETARLDENALVAVLKAEGFDGKRLR